LLSSTGNIRTLRIISEVQADNSTLRSNAILRVPWSTSVILPSGE
jgi:hypothetical protein